jgi:serine/threonine protein phosphatase PrpC
LIIKKQPTALAVVANSHVGKVRAHNEDAYRVDGTQGLYLVADGMGGHAAGEEASQLAVATVPAEVANGQPLPTAIQAAHHAILKQADSNPEQKGMGTTIAAVQHRGLVLNLAWVGDSRIYCYRNQQLQQLSIDHSFVQDMVLRGALTEEEARNHPNSSLIRQALGKQDLLDVKVDTLSLPLDHCGIVMLCSDGVSDMLNEAVMAEIFTRHQNDLEALSQAIEQAVMVTAASDNFTTVLLGYRPSVLKRGLANLMLFKKA